jgi:hypothetical protein
MILSIMILYIRSMYKLTDLNYVQLSTKVKTSVN